MYAPLGRCRCIYKRVSGYCKKRNMGTNSYSRRNRLNENINEFLFRITGERVDFASKITRHEYFEFKNLLSDINNTITLLTAISTIKWISIITKAETNLEKKWMSDVDAQKPNTSGFDIIINEPDIKVIAEVKSTNPINGDNYFGSAQKDSLIKDIRKLLEGNNQIKETKEFVKILAITNIDDRTENAVKDFLTKGRNNNKLSSWRVKYHEIINNELVVFCPNDLELNYFDKNKVYIKLIEIEE